MENSNNIQNWKSLIHLFNLPYQEYLNLITLQPNTSPQYEVLSQYLEELEVSELEHHFIIETDTPFPSGIYQEIIDLHLFHYPNK